MKRSILLIILIVSAVTAASAQVYSPDKQSPERRAILDALRVPVERELKQKVVFIVENMNVSGNWAFVGGGRLQAEDGGEPDFSRTQYADAKREGFFDNNYFSLLKKTAGKWKVTHYAIGCTDVCYATWWRDYRAPKAIFPYTE